MKYTTLSTLDTKVWLQNVNNTLLLIRKVISTSNAVEVNVKRKALEHHHRNKFSTVYSQLLYGLYDIDDIFISTGSGTCFCTGGMLFDLLNFQLTEEELALTHFCTEIIEDLSVEFCCDINHAWTVYADKPFDIDEADIINYRRILRIHELCKEALSNVGAYDETLNVVEDSRSRC